MPDFDIFRPGKCFPSISITGTRCELHCMHCNGKYLYNMTPAETPERLMEVCTNLEAKGATGVLISGGCQRDGSIAFDRFIPAISEIHRNTGLKLNIHTGITGRAQLDDLVSAGVDTISADIVGDPGLINRIYGVSMTSGEYDTYIDALAAHSDIVVPHLCIGLEAGFVRSEGNAIKMIKEKLNPASLVFIIFMPTKDTSFHDRPPPLARDVKRIFMEARTAMPDTKLLLGCMRPRKQEYEDAALEAKLDGIVNPSSTTIDNLKLGRYDMNTIQGCCAVSWDR